MMNRVVIALAALLLHAADVCAYVPSTAAASRRVHTALAASSSPTTSRRNALTSSGAALGLLLVGPSAARAEKTPSGTRYELAAEPGQEVTLPSGVTFTIVKPGVGELAVPGRSVTIEYTLYTGGFDGTRVDSSKISLRNPVDGSIKSGKDTPFLFTPGGSPSALPAGIEEVILKSMTVGEKRRVVLPPGKGREGNALGLMKLPPDSETVYAEIRLRSISLNTPGMKVIGLNIF